MSTTYAVHGTDVEMSKIGIITLATEARSNDQGYQINDGADCSIALAHGTDGNAYIVLCTNGDDQVIAWVDEDGDIEVVDDAAAGIDEGWFKNFSSAAGKTTTKDWLASLLSDNKVSGFRGDGTGMHCGE